MPSIGHFLALFEAVSRRDWKAIQEIGNQVAQEERKKKHYDAAHQLLQAVEVASSSSGFELVGNVAKTNSNALSPPPPALLQQADLHSVEAPILSPQLKSNVIEFVAEWRAEKRLNEVGLAPRQTVLLHGPPGCGKSHLAHHLAQSLEMRLFTVRFDSLISSFLGETGGNLRQVFDFVAANRCVLFIDEIDAIAKLRDDRNELGELKRVVISLLQNLDLTNTRSLLVAATNHPHMLDPAIWRRFQIVWEMNLPDASDRRQLFEQYLKESLPRDLEKLLLKVSDGLSGADIEEIATGALRKRLLSDGVELSESILLSAIEYLRRESTIPTHENDRSERLLSLALELKDRFNRKYSFNDLENLSGIPHSTIHSKSATGSERIV